MLKMILRPNTIRRFCHTNSKTVLQENSNNNNKVIEELLMEQNEILKNMYKKVDFIAWNSLFMGWNIIFHLWLSR